MVGANGQLRRDIFQNTASAVLHVLAPPPKPGLQDYRRLHGKRVQWDKGDVDNPSFELLEWHYAQALRGRLAVHYAPLGDTGSIGEEDVMPSEGEDWRASEPVLEDHTRGLTNGTQADSEESDTDYGAGSQTRARRRAEAEQPGNESDSGSDWRLEGLDEAFPLDSPPLGLRTTDRRYRT